MLDDFHSIHYSFKYRLISIINDQSQYYFKKINN